MIVTIVTIASTISITDTIIITINTTIGITSMITTIINICTITIRALRELSYVILHDKHWCICIHAYTHAYINIHNTYIYMYIYIYMYTLHDYTALYYITSHYAMSQRMIPYHIT